MKLRIAECLIRLALTGIAGQFVPSACASEVIDSGILLGEFPVIRWMDNDRVIFLAASGEHCKRQPRPDSYRQPLNRIAVFDTRTRKLTWYGDTGINGLCYAQGHIAYARRKVEGGYCPSDEWEYFRGIYGQEKLQPGVKLERYTCLPESEVRPIPRWLEKARQSGRQFKPLKVEHGWVEMAIHSRRGIRANPTYPIKIYPPGATEEGGFPVSDIFRQHLGEGFSLWSPEYVSFKDAYFILLDYYQSVRPTGSPLGWWMFPDGRVEALVLANPLSQTWGNLVFTRSGNLLIRMSFTRKTHHEAGIYIDDVKGPMNLFSGRVQEKASVSPDGCKVAFGNDPRPDVAPGSERYILHMIDVCERNSK